jgi:aromatic-L-amino-acid decarboxylase
MINNDEFRKHAHKIVDWIADYYRDIEKYPVKSPVKPGEIISGLPGEPPGDSESMQDIIADFERIILPGVTHWQSPDYYAYFPANSSYPSLLAEMLTAGLAAQCMIWDTSPAAAELEEQMMKWLIKMTGLPETWEGVIQDGASTATLTSLITAREAKTGFSINAKGFKDQPDYRIYCSTEAHSSIEKAAKIAGFGQSNVVKLAVDKDLALIPSELEKAIVEDLRSGFKPLAVVAAIGTTGTTAVDPIGDIGKICDNHGLWFHIDAAFAGTALLLPEYRWMIDGINRADSFVFNPHKWMFTNFDCTAYFVKDPELLIRTFEILPEYLKTFSRGQVNDYRDWGIPMGRRFRALKLWFVIRDFGVAGLQERIREHISIASELEGWIGQEKDFELMAKRQFNLVCFRFKPEGIGDENELDRINQMLEKRVNETGRLFITHTKVNNRYTLRMVVAQTYVSRDHVWEAWGVVRAVARNLSSF